MADPQWLVPLDTPYMEKRGIARHTKENIGIAESIFRALIFLLSSFFQFIINFKQTYIIVDFQPILDPSIKRFQNSVELANK